MFPQLESRTEGCAKGAGQSRVLKCQATGRFPLAVAGRSKHLFRKLQVFLHYGAWFDLVFAVLEAHVLAE